MKPNSSTHPVMARLAAGETAIGVIGLGYVGLPLAVAFARRFKVVGFDISREKIDELKRGVDRTREVEDPADLLRPNFKATHDTRDLAACQILIVAVPTPVDEGRTPDLKPLLAAARTVGSVIGSGPPKYVCFESTVYPGCTEEDCVPVIEQASERKHGRDFFVGYSPERINPGDRERRFESITKVVSGCSPDSTELFAQLYGSVVTAGIHRAATIKVAEAAKVIENTQRDLNIALMNELAIIFSRLGIDTRDVLEAAATKWNFLRFWPGLVGGHCIGVDPYYLTYKAQTVGYVPQVILAGRGVNDGMASFVAIESVKRTIDRPPVNGQGYRALILGFTFKENVPDMRNTKVIELVRTLRSFRFETEVVDPVADPAEVAHEYGETIHTAIPESMRTYDLVVLAVAHDPFRERLPVWLSELRERNAPLTLIDVKGLVSKEDRMRLPGSVRFWRI